jgi:cellulose synthase/poly-beta-1,6-N-acetylglucosamine synthase-like glycosyltransferase
MVWYQKFEYAVAHWLQKSTEHVLGCVLCSPGCFSLFRGSALMDDNIMRKYTIKPTEASHHLMYDQGMSNLKIKMTKSLTKVNFPILDILARPFHYLAPKDF